MPHHLTPRALALLLLALPLFIAASVWRPLLWVALLYVAGMGLLVLVDALMGLPRDALTVSRENDSRLSLGADNTVTIQVTALRLGPPLPITVRDEPPDEYEISNRLLAGTIRRAGQPLRLSYSVKPFARGDYAFGVTTLRWPGPLGLVVRQARYDSAAPVKVYPNLLDVKKYDLLARANRLHEIGMRRVRVRGRGTEFERLRDYNPDDEFSQISWKATARRGQPVAIEYQNERSQTVIALLDVGRLMRAPIGPLAKLDYALNTTLLLGYVAGSYGDYVGAMLFADRDEGYLPPRPGRAHFLRLLETLYNVQSQPTEPDYKRAVAALRARRPRRALVLLFTDLAAGSDLNELVSAMASLRPSHVPMVVTMKDPGVLALASQPPSDSKALYERTIAEELLDERALVLERLARRGVLTVDVPAHQLNMAVVNRYLELKARHLL